MEPGGGGGYTQETWSTAVAPRGRPHALRPDRALNPNHVLAAGPLATPSSPNLDAFVRAASAGQLVWAGWVQGRLEVFGGATPAPAASDEVGRLFVAALRERFGDAASAVAEREWQLGTQPRRLLPARTVRRAVACAESAFSLFEAQAYLVQLEFSAVMLGWRFRRVAEALGLDPGAMDVERRRALDLALEADFHGLPPVDADAVAGRLRALLQQAVH